MVWTIVGIAVGVISNILVWVFLFARRIGGQDERLKALEYKSILPQCAEIFTEIKEKLSHLTGKIDVILLVMKENQKNDEKKVTRGEK